MKEIINNRQCRRGVMKRNKEVLGEAMLNFNELLWEQFERKRTLTLKPGALLTKFKTAFQLHV